MINKKLKQKLVKQMNYVYQRLSPQDDKCIAAKNLLRLHYTLCILLLVSFFLIPNIYYQLFILSGTIFVVFTNIIFSGCVITMMEQNLCPGMETVFDWPLDLFGIPVTNKNRKIVTVLFFSCVILIMIFVFYYLHIYQKA
jgi:hypothetical protein